MVAEKRDVWRVVGELLRIASTCGAMPMSNIWSASSTTTVRSARVWSARRPIRSRTRPGVPTTICAPARRPRSCGTSLTPPTILTTRSLVPRVRDSNTDAIWSAQLTRGRENQRLRGRLALRNLGHYREGVCERLAGSSACLANHVSPRMKQRDARLLNGSGLGDLVRGENRHEIGLHAQFAETIDGSCPLLVTRDVETSRRGGANRHVVALV